MFDAQPFHMEKYVVPGAVAVGLLFLFPWYLLGRTAHGDSVAGSFDLATVVIAALVLGHVVESLKVYEWGKKVRKNRDSLNDKTLGLFAADGKVNFETAMRTVLNLVSAGRRSEFTWNLVRWQKMVVVGKLLYVASFEWLLFSLLCLLEQRGWNPFTTTWTLKAFKDGLQPIASFVCEFLLAAVLWVTAYCIYRFGLKRQQKTNDFLFDLIVEHRVKIIDLVRQVATTEKQQASAA
jgi:hypothetical protein